MPGSVSNDIAKFEFQSSNANKVQSAIAGISKEINTLEKTNERLRVQQVKLEAQGKRNTKEWNNVRDAIKNNNAAISQHKTALKQQESQLKLTDLNAYQLQKRMNALTRELRGTVKAHEPDKWNKLNKELNETQEQFNKVSGKSKQTQTSLSQLKALLPAIGFALIVNSLKNITTSLKNAGSEAEETEAKFDTTFQGINLQAEAVAKNLARNYGLATDESKKLLSTTGDLLTGFGFSRQAALGMSEQVQQLAVDLASFNNLEGGATQASEALTKGLLGERESLKSLGIVISEESVKQKLLEEGMSGLKGQALLQAKAYATLQLAIEQSGNAMGDFARTSDGVANKERILEATNRDLATTLGDKLLPGYSKMLDLRIKINRSIQDWIETKPSEALQEEQSSLNILINTITDANTSEEERSNLLKQIQKQYPDFLGNLNAETATNKELAARLVEVNEQYINRIILAKKQEEIDKLANKAADKGIKLDDARNNLTRDISEAIRILNIEEKAAGKTMEERLKLINEEAIAQGNFDILYGETTSSLKSLTLEYDTYNKALERSQVSNKKVFDLEKERNEYAKENGLGDLLKKNQDQFDPTATTGETDLKPQGTGTPDPKAQKEALKLLLENLEEHNEQELNAIREKRNQQIIDEQEFKDLEIEQELAYLIAKQEILAQNGETTNEIQGQILDKEFEIKQAYEERIREEKEQTLNELIENFELEEEANTKRLDNEINGEIKAQDTIRKERKKSFDEEQKLKQQQLENERKQKEELQNISEAFFTATGELLGSALVGEEKSLRKYAKNFIFVMLDSVKKVIRLQIASATAQSLAQPDSIATFGASGVARSIIIGTLIEAAFGAAKAAVDSAIPTSGEYFIGGYTGGTQKHKPAGIVHEGEYVVAQEELAIPPIGGFVANVIEPTRQRRLNFSGINTSISANRGYADGGLATQQANSPLVKGGQGDLQQQAQQNQLLNQSILMLAATTNKLNQILTNGSIIIGYNNDTITDIRDRISTQESIENDNRLT